MRKRLFTLTMTGMGMLYALLFSGCSYYVPQVGHIPLMSQRGELVAEAGIGPAAMDAFILVEDASVCPWIYQAACAYAPTDHLALQLSSRKFDDTRHQIMAGYYTPLGENATVEAYGGYAYARCDFSTGASTDGYDDLKQFGNMQTLFVQGDIGFPSYKPSWSKKTYFTAAFGLRAGGLWLNYTERTYDWFRDEEYPDGHVVQTSSSKHTPTGFELQPILQLGVGGERLKCEVAAGYSWLAFPHAEGVHAEPYTLNLSLTYRIPLKRNKQTP